MTREEIMNMPAGEQLDALIAEKVMGWFHNEINSNGRLFTLWHPNDSIMTRLEKPLPYSTDIATAWKVFEKLIELKAWLRVAFEFDDKDKGWWCEFSKPNYEDLDTVLAVDTAPLAICRAALLAVQGIE